MRFVFRLAPQVARLVSWLLNCRHNDANLDLQSPCEVALYAVHNNGLSVTGQRLTDPLSRHDNLRFANTRLSHI